MQSVVLIGPYGVGKSTVAELLATARSQSYYALDECAWNYYRETGLTPETVETVGDFDSPKWQPYHAHAVTRFLHDHQPEICVMDLGAGHALYDGCYLDKMKTVLAPYEVILLLPSPQLDRSMHDLNVRNSVHAIKQTQPHAEWNTFFLNHPSSYQLARHIVYTGDKTPLETSNDILALLHE